MHLKNVAIAALLSRDGTNTWNAFKSLQYGSVRRQPITTAFKYGYRWQISNSDAFTVPRMVSTRMPYCCSHSRINVSISSNGLFGWMYKHSSDSFGYRFENKLTNMCNSTVQSLPPLNDRNISLDSYVSSVLFKTYGEKFTINRHKDYDGSNVRWNHVHWCQGYDTTRHYQHTLEFFLLSIKLC